MSPVVAELVAICRAFGALERQAVCCGTVSVPQCVALQALLERQQEVSELAAFAGVASSTMTRLVDGLEERGFVERRRPTDGDRRRVLCALTPSGRAEAERLSALTDRYVEAVLAAVPPARQKGVLSALRLVRRAIEQAREGGSGPCC